MSNGPILFKLFINELPFTHFFFGVTRSDFTAKFMFIELFF